jgi:hypothetical protein
MTPKEFGQLRCLKDRCGLDTQHVIEFVLHWWQEFTDCVRRLKAIESVPMLPHIGFLLKFYKIAVEMMAVLCPDRVKHVLAKWAADSSS